MGEKIISAPDTDPRVAIAAAQKAKQVAAFELAIAKREHDARKASRILEAEQKAERKAIRQAEKDLLAAAKREAIANGTIKTRKTKERECRNGVYRPAAKFQCGKLWQLFDQLALDDLPTDYVAIAVTEGYNKNTVLSQYNFWRRFNGL